MITKPLLILAFNRPTHVKKLIDTLRPHAPQKILVSVDGPRQGNKTDPEKISQVIKEIENIDWTQDIELRIRERNLGLRFAVADAVTWVIDKYGEVIVVEDDIEVGPEFLDFMSAMLDEYRNDKEIGHISGYNLVPVNELENPSMKIRLSLIPESYAWATWGRAWVHYDSSLEWARAQSMFTLRGLLGSFHSALIWKINFYDARLNNINTWAYRWVASLWKNDLKCISPNRNLICYTGQLDGTHTRLLSNVKELPIESLPASLNYPDFDKASDAWIHRKVFKATFVGLLSRSLSSLILSLLRALDRFRRRKCH